MQVQFADKDVKQILERVQKNLEENSLRKLVRFSLEGENLVLIVSKLGKSYVTLSSEDSQEGGLIFSVSHEKILPHHKVLKPMVIGELKKVLVKSGAIVLS